MVSLQSLCDLIEAAALVPYLPLIEAVKLSLVPGWWKGRVDSCGSVPWRAFRALGYHLCHCFILSTINGSLDKVECQGWSREMTACHMASQICSLCLVARIQRFRIWNSGCCSTHNVVSHWYRFECCPSKIMNIDYSASDHLTPMSKSLVLVFLPPLVPKFLWTQGCQPEIPALKYIL